MIPYFERFSNFIPNTRYVVWFYIHRTGWKLIFSGFCWFNELLIEICHCCLKNNVAYQVGQQYFGFRYVWKAWDSFSWVIKYWLYLIFCILKTSFFDKFFFCVVQIFITTYLQVSFQYYYLIIWIWKRLGAID